MFNYKQFFLVKYEVDFRRRECVEIIKKDKISHGIE